MLIVTVVMLVILRTGSGSSVATTSIDFTSMDACNKAAIVLKQNNVVQSAYCFQK